MRKQVLFFVDFSLRPLRQSPAPLLQGLPDQGLREIVHDLTEWPDLVFLELEQCPIGAETGTNGCHNLPFRECFQKLVRRMVVEGGMVLGFCGWWIGNAC